MLATVSDKKQQHSSDNANVDFWEADVATANDYFPFGMVMPGRKYENGNGYRYGFNGKENDNEVKGEGNQQDYGMRIYDPRLGRFLSVDPLTRKFPYYSTYQFSGNSPIKFIDLDGGEPQNSDNDQLKGKESKMYLPNLAFSLTGGDKKYFWQTGASYGEEVIKVDKSKFFTNNPSDKMGRYVNTNSQFIVKKENKFLTEKDLVNKLLGDFLWGKGPENTVFPHNGKFSNLLKSSVAVGEGLVAWNKAGKKDGVYNWGINWRGEVNVDVNSGFTSLEHFLGSVSLKITKVDDDMIKVEIFNVTSLTSGDFDKEIPIINKLIDPLKSIPRNPNTYTQTDHTNTSQYFSFDMSTSEADKLIKQYGPPK